MRKIFKYRYFVGLVIVCSESEYAPDVKLSQGRGAAIQESCRQHTELTFLVQLNFSQTSRAEGSILSAAVEGRERRNQL